MTTIRQRHIYKRLMYIPFLIFKKKYDKIYIENQRKIKINKGEVNEYN